MRVLHLSTKTLFGAIIASFVFLVTPGSALGGGFGGGGIEPGAGCEAALPGFTCAAVHGAPMSGIGTVVWPGDSSPATFSGQLEQFGPSDCTLTDFGGNTVPLPDIPNKPTFDALTAPDLRGFCLQQIIIEGAPPCPTDTGNAEVLAANRLTRGPNVFTVEVLVLPIRCTP